MTLRDRKHIVEYLSGTTERQKPILSFVRKGLLQDSLNEKGETCLSHTCPAYPSVQLEITLVITESGQLTSCAKYGASPSASRSTLISIAACCGNGLSWYLDKSATHTCGYCRARIFPLPRPAASSKSRAVQVTRFLGRETWFADPKSSAGSAEFDGQWRRQCRNASSYIPD